MRKTVDAEPVKDPDRMSSYWKREWKSIAVVTVTGTVFNMGMSLIAVWQGHLIDALVNRSSLTVLMRTMLIFVGITAAVQVLRYFKRYYVRVFANATRARMRLAVYRNIIHMDIRDIAKEKTGDLMTRAIGDVDLCVEGMRKVTTEIFDTGVLMATYFVTLLMYDWKCTLPACLFIPAAMWIAARLKGVIAKQTRLARAQSSTVAEYTYDAVGNVILYRMNGLDREIEDSYDEQLVKLGKLSIKANILENSMQPVYNAVSLIGAVIVICYGGANVAAGIWTIGMFSSYSTIFLALAAKSSKAAKLFNSYQKAAVSWQRVKEYLHPYSEDAAGKAIACKDQIPAVCCTDAGCGWLGADDPLKDMGSISFKAERGEIIGITGPVACGKSVLALAMTGMYDYSGSIKLFGHELRDYDQKERSSLISYMGHMPQLFDTTIEENITLGNKDHGSVSGVLRDVCFDRDLQDMPDGTDTTVGSSGVRLSGGQKARITLARTLYHMTPVIILDEPFASVDIHTEQQIINNVRRDYKDSLIIIVSHRLRIFPETDRIILLEKGSPCVVGTHEELLETSELYSSIFALQSEQGDQ